MFVACATNGGQTATGNLSGRDNFLLRLLCVPYAEQTSQHIDLDRDGQTTLPVANGKREREEEKE